MTFWSSRILDEFLSVPVPFMMEPISCSMGNYLEYRRGDYIFRIHPATSGSHIVVSLTLPGRQYVTRSTTLNPRSQALICSALSTIHYEPEAHPPVPVNEVVAKRLLNNVEYFVEKNVT